MKNPNLEENATIEPENTPHWINFRTRNNAQWQRWLDLKKWCEDHGLDTCHVTTSLIDSFMKDVEGSSSTNILKMPGQTIHIHQRSTFVTSVARYRREPFNLSCVKEEYQRTFSSILFEAYVLNKAREINREFSYRDFLELKHDAFRRIALRLRRKGKIIANPERTVPRFYILTERLRDYQK